MSQEIITNLKALPLFAKLAEDELGKIVDLVGQAQFPTGSIIYRQGDKSDKFYIILSGQVLLTVRDEAGAEAILARPGKGAYFGENDLLKAQARNATATAMAETRLCTFTEESFNLLLQRLPQVEAQLTTHETVHIGGEQKHFNWQLEDEVVLLFARRHWASLLGAIPPILLATLISGGLIFLALEFLTGKIWLMGVVSLLAVLFWLLVIAWYIVDWSNDSFILTNRRAVHIERIAFISETRTEVPVEAIQEVNLDKPSLLANWLNYGTIRIQTAGAGLRGIQFTALPDPDMAQQQILEQRSRIQSEARSERREAMRYEIQKAITPPGAPPPPPPKTISMITPIPTSRPPLTLWERLGEIAQVRIEREGQIIWRKHWLRLIQQLFRPILVLALGFVLWAFIPRLASLLLPVAWLVLALGGLWFAWEWADWSNDLYILTPSNIIDIDRLPLKLRESRREGALEQIQDIEVMLPTFWANLFNVGNVRIKTAASGGDFTFDSVFDPRGVQRDIFHQLARYRRQQELRRRQGEFEAMAQWFSVYNELANRSAQTAGKQP